jgi:hypothetical protein
MLLTCVLLLLVLLSASTVSSPRHSSSNSSNAAVLKLQAAAMLQVRPRKAFYMLYATIGNQALVTSSAVPCRATKAVLQVQQKPFTCG